LDLSIDNGDANAVNMDAFEWTGGGLCWDPHNSSILAAVTGSALKIIDTRKMEITIDIAAHRGGARYITLLYIPK
jgi:hypothetical protein